MIKRRLKIFLSHSGMDSDRSKSFQQELEDRFKNLGYQVKIFNTSTVEDRFKELKSIIAGGDDWIEQVKQYEEELRKYLEQNLVDSTAYLLLVTPKSLKANSQWIQFEIETAKSKAIIEGRSFFFPCVADGAALADLPSAAMEFQGLELEAPGSIEKFVKVIIAEAHH